jgi:two-component system, chemotaxis family, protein-glutamate methylesterase/glutaminase
MGSARQDDAPEIQPIFPEAAYDLVGIAASAGGLRAIMRILEDLPGNFPAAIAVVQHLDPHHPSMMVPILARHTDLHVVQADQCLVISASTVYVAPPDQHLLINPDRTIALSHAQLVHFVRPSADLLFESAAATLRARMIAVVLSGTGMDGSMGIKAVKKMGGMIIAQDEATAEFYGMPGAAVQTGLVDYVLPIEAIAPKLLMLVTRGDQLEQQPSRPGI